MSINYEQIENNSKVYFNGSVWNSNNCRTFTIVGKTNRHRIDNRGYEEYKYYLCQFEDGTIVEAKTSEIKKGKVRNPNCPSICGKGYLGEGDWKFYINCKPTKEYSLFHNIITRCYDKTSKSYPYYGGCGVTLDENLFNFQNFCEMLTRLPNYDNWKNSFDLYQLDKDILCEKFNINPKIYSEKTCQFIIRKENMGERNKRVSVTGLTYIGINSSGDEIEFTNIKEFARKYNLQDSNVGKCIRGIAKKHKGWRFKVKEINNESYY